MAPPMREPYPPRAGSGSNEQDANNEPDFEAHIFGQPGETRVLRQRPFGNSKKFCESRKNNRLESDQDCHSCKKQRIDVESYFSDHQRTRKQHRANRDPQGKQGHSRVKEQPAGTVQQKETERPPAVSPGAKVRWPAAAVRRKCCGNLRNAKAEGGRLDDHLIGVFHSLCAQPQLLDHLSAKRPKTAIDIPNRRLKKQPGYRREDGVAQILMQRRHGPRQDSAFEAIPHYQVVTFPQFVDKQVGLREVVAVVGIAHQDVAASRCSDASAQCAPVAAYLNRNYARPVCCRNLLRSVRAAVIAADHFPADSVLLHCAKRFLDARRNRRPLVKTWHHHGELDVLAGFDSVWDYLYFCD